MVMSLRACRKRHAQFIVRASKQADDRSKMTAITGNGPAPASASGAADQWLTPGRFALLLAFLVAAAFPGVLLGGTTFVIRDFSMFSYPVAFFHRQCFWRGELPLWNPLSHCGVPFLAQWNTLTLYPPSLIYLLLPLTWSLSFFCLVHLFWAGLGMYLLAHHWTGHRLAAALAGVIFAFNGLTLNFLMWPSHVATFGWLPWVVWLGQRGWREGGQTLVWATAAGAMQMLAGGPETILATWFILLLLACGDWFSKRELRRKLLWRFLLMGILVTLVCAAQLLPFLELLTHSQRNTTFGSSEWSMPAWGWANFLVPLFRAYPTEQGLFLQIEQNWTSSYYTGIGTVILVAVAVRRVRDWRVRLLAMRLVVSLVLALGDRGLLFHVLRSCVPLVGFARYPIKFVILTLAIAPLLAAFGLRAITDGGLRIGRFEWACVTGILCLVVALIGIAVRDPLHELLWRGICQNGLARAGFLVLMFVLTAACLRSSGRARILCGCLLLVVCWLDLATHVPAQNPTVRPWVYAPGLGDQQREWGSRPKLGQARAMLSPAAEEIIRLHQLPDFAQNYLISRVALFADCNLLDGVPQVYGFFSLAPGEANDATCIAYVRTNSNWTPLLDFMGVSQITAPDTVYRWLPRPTAMPWVTAGQRPVFAEDQTIIDAFAQTNTDLRRIVFLPPEARGVISATQSTSARVLNADFTNQKVSIQTDAPTVSMVVISQAHYPAWKAYVDGHPAKIWRANYAFQAVEVPAGMHKVELRYEDAPLRNGTALSAFGLLACLGIWLQAHRRDRSAQRTPALATQPDAAANTT